MLQNSFSAEQWYACSFPTTKREISYALWISFATELYHAGWMVSEILALLKPLCFWSGFHLMVSKSNERMLVCKGFQSHFSDGRFDVLISRLAAWSSSAYVYGKAFVELKAPWALTSEMCRMLCWKSVAMITNKKQFSCSCTRIPLTFSVNFPFHLEKYLSLWRKS